MPTVTKPPQHRVPQTICLIGFVLLPAIAAGQNVPNRESQSGATQARLLALDAVANGAAMPAVVEKTATRTEGISYVGGQLRINVSHSTLAEVLTKVAALTGVSIEVPEGARSEEIPTLELGPGPARQIVASLLSESNFDYLIQGSESDPEKIQSVLLLPRGKKDSASEVPGRPGRSPYVRAAVAPPEEVPAPEPPVAPPDQSAAAALSPPNPQPLPDPPTPVGQPDLSAPPVFGQPLQTNVPKTFPVAPPANFDQQTVGQQLQQMYQQRMQMLQQGRQDGSNK